MAKLHGARERSDTNHKGQTMRAVVFPSEDPQKPPHIRVIDMSGRGWVEFGINEYAYGGPCIEVARFSDNFEWLDSYGLRTGSPRETLQAYTMARSELHMLISARPAWYKPLRPAAGSKSLF